MEASKNEYLNNRRSLKIFGVLIIIVLIAIASQWQFIMMAFLPQLDPLYEPEYTMIVWIEPKDAEFNLYIDVYLDQADVGDTTLRHGGHEIRVEPNDPVENELFIYTVPIGLETLWIESYVNPEGERVTIELEMEIRTAIPLTGYSVEALVTPLETT